VKQPSKEVGVKPEALKQDEYLLSDALTDKASRRQCRFGQSWKANPKSALFPSVLFSDLLH
jgi:hypothetical protein